MESDTGVTAAACLMSEGSVSCICFLCLSPLQSSCTQTNCVLAKLGGCRGELGVMVWGLFVVRGQGECPPHSGRLPGDGF